MAPTANQDVIFQPAGSALPASATVHLSGKPAEACRKHLMSMRHEKPICSLNLCGLPRFFQVGEFDRGRSQIFLKPICHRDLLIQIDP